MSAALEALPLDFSVTGLIRLSLAQLAAPQSRAPLRLPDALDRLIVERRRRPEGERAWIGLANALALSNLEVFAGQLALLSESDAPVIECLQRLQAAGGAGSPRPSLGLVARLWSLLEPAGADLERRRMGTLVAGVGVDSGTFQVARDGLLINRTLSLHPHLLPHLLEADVIEPAALRFDEVTLRAVTPPDWALPSTWQGAIAEKLPALQAHGPSTLLVRCADADEARQLALLVAEQAGLRAIEVLHAAAAPPPGLEPWLLASARTPLLVADAAPGERVELPRWSRYRGPLLVAVSADTDVHCEHGDVQEWRPALPDSAERDEVLSASLPGADLLRRTLARRWRAGVGALNRVAGKLRELGDDTELDESHLATVLAAESERALRRFGGLAQSLRTRISDDALVTPPALRAELDLLLERCRRREDLHANLGVTVQARAHSGVKALFTGASGTGKTLAAQWLAHRLGKPLLRVDAANVMSKYIGETEKNLAQLLAQAEQFDCVLLFDEADAILGSRTDVKQANDRFANAQTNYLLTRLESFDGVAILTSNSRARFDQAFMRRLDALLEFPLPAAAERRDLWRAHLGRHTLGDAFIDRLAAAMELPGGNIRNVVVAAALRAGPRAIAAADMVAALESEYARLGRHAPAELSELAQVR